MIKKILIIEDNETKLQHIMEFCKQSLKKCILNDKQSYNSAQQEVIFHGHEYDLILLDVAGANILRFMKLRHILTPVVVVTMYESFVDGVRINALDERFKTQYKDIYKGFVYYNLKSDDWKDELMSKLKNVLQ